MAVRTLAFLLAVFVLIVPRGAANAQRAPGDAGQIILKKLDEHLYHTEHALFIIDTENRLGWPDFMSVLVEDNLFYFADELQAHFPDSFMTITVSALNLVPDYVPRYLPYGPLIASGIGRYAQFYEQDFCLHTEGGDHVTDRALAAMDHEIGHAWGVFLPFADNFHWPPHSTIYGQMARVVSRDNFNTVDRIVGNEVDGFFWRNVSDHDRNRRQIYSDQQLYLMGLEPRFPDAYVLRDPVYNPDSTMSYSSFAKYTHDDVVTMMGPREPGYRTSPKQFRLAFVFVARSLDEVENTHEAFETAVRHFTYSREIAPSFMDMRVPFLLLTKMRASVSTRLADLDGNASPHVTIAESYASTDLNAIVEIPFEASDPDGTPLAVQCFGSECRIENDRVVVGPNVSKGAYFYTLHVEDAGGKHAFAHFVVDVALGDEANEQPSISNGFALHPPYPNPFRTSTTFAVDVREAGRVVLDVHELHGRRVTRIDGGSLSPGRHELIWNADDLSSGTYFVRIAGGTASGSRSVTLIK